MGSTGKLRARDRWLALLAGLGFLIVCLAATAARPKPSTVTQSTPLSPPAGSASRARPISDDLEAPPRTHSWHLHPPWWLFDRLLDLLLGLAVVLVILLIVWLVPKLGGPRIRRRRAPEEAEYVPVMSQQNVSRQVSDTLDDTLAAFRRGDRERAIIACWIRLEQIAEAAGAARDNSETSSELADRWLGLLPVSREPLLALAELYREARYSSHRLPESALDTARAALGQLRREIAPTAARGPMA